MQILKLRRKQINAYKNITRVSTFREENSPLSIMTEKYATIHSVVAFPQAV